MKEKPFLSWIFFSAFLLVLSVGCSGTGKVKTVEGAPETLYREGLALFNKRDYLEAREKFQELKSNFPDSPPFTVWAELKVGDCHFLMEEYVEAIAAYEEFKKIHPTHGELPYVQFQIGMSYFNQMHSHDRDQTPTKKALSNFEYLIANMPASLFTEKAKEKIEICRKRLADHEFYVGNFYYKKEKFQAAAMRFEELLKNYPKEAGGEETLYLLGMSYLGFDQREKAKEVFTRVITEYPGSPRSRDAKILLDLAFDKKIPQPKAKKPAEVDMEGIPLIKFEEEGRQVLSLKEEREGEEKGVSLPPFETRQPGSTPETGVKIDFKPDDERRGVAPPTSPGVTEGKEREKAKLPKGILPEPGEGKGEDKDKKDTSQPIDITSDRVETFSKERLILFKGNVVARQKDMVIYADTIETKLLEEGKGIETVVADGNVKIQQGVRVATGQKAVFYNLDRKVVLTGAPKVWEGENMVSGEEIIFNIDQNRVEVKGGSRERGKVKIYPRGESEPLK
jgi:outer membrane protein assembly factor BamD